MHTATYGPPCQRCGARTEHRHDENGFNYESVQRHLTGCSMYAVGPESAIAKRAREVREARLARYTVTIDWAWGHARGGCEVTIDAPGAEQALIVALRHNMTRVVTDGGAGIVAHTVAYTPNAELTPEEEF